MTENYARERIHCAVINANLPTWLCEGIYNFAYQHWHPYGLEEVVTCALVMVNDFEQAKKSSNDQSTTRTLDDRTGKWHGDQMD